MDVKVVNQSITDIIADAIIVNLFEGVTRPGGATGAVDAATGGLITRLIEHKEFSGKLNETVTVYSSRLPAKKIVVVGLGKADKFDPMRARQAAGSAIRAAMKGDTKTVATITHGAGIGGLQPQEAAQATVEGSILGAYTFTGFTSRKEPGPLAEILIAEKDAAKLALLSKGATRGKVLAEATNWARDMVNTPANHMTPSHMAQAAREMAEEFGLECKVLDREDMERLGMGVLLGVTQGSAQPPKMIVLSYHGNPGGEKLALVGKGITFDSGGISLKSREGMELMKDDMAGAAAVVAAMRAIAQLRPRSNVLGIAACTENLPSGTALKPGDVLKSMTGKTIEIISTDAEGRLILADAVAYAESLGATRIVDVATLTGAASVALGKVYSAIVSNCDHLVSLIQAAANRAGERFWRLPADDEYREQYRSDVADIKNSGGREGGTITGGLIISEFIKKASWAHLDIAATCYVKEDRPFMAKGATGIATRTLAELAEVIAQH